MQLNGWGTLMALRGYYDGSGKFDDPNAEALTLGGFAASPETWCAFETAWEKALRDKHVPTSARGTQYFHSKEAMHGAGGYKGWSQDRVVALISDLLQVLTNADRTDLVAFCCTIRIASYRSFKTWAPKVRPAEIICLDHCIGTMFQHRHARHPIEIFFDRGEKFQHPLNRAWRTKQKGGRKLYPWAEHVLHVGPISDSREVLGIQAADLLSWLANRYYTEGPENIWGRWFAMLAISRRIAHRYYDLNALAKTFDRDGRYRPGIHHEPESIATPRGVRVSFGPQGSAVRTQLTGNIRIRVQSL